ncbi:hypothetical protein CK203_099542 [Vitis vinifera]|uniref:Uncharacterized protein n=1 Tax=Vitis vinifera TaxID=29760 RepID=A0A438CJ59_VITVI|nr:hypothetical protein CK203_099542 [Vitis vinifera]
MTWNLRYKCCSSFDDKVIDIHRDRRWGSHSARESDLNKIQPQPSCNFTVGNWPNDGCLQSPFVNTGSTDDGFLPSVVIAKALVKMLESGLSASLHKDVWTGDLDLLGFIWTFLAPKVFFSPAIISSAFYILQFQSLPSHRPHHLPSSTTLAFCLTATPVAVYLPDGPVDCYSSALGCTFIYGSGASLVLGLRPLWGMVKAENLGWGLPCRPKGSGDCFLITGHCAVQVLLSPLLQHVSMRGCGFHQCGWECFHILHGVSIRLMDGGPMPTEKELFNATIFSKEQFNAGLHFLFLHSLSPWVGSYEHPGRKFEPRRSLPILGKKKRDRLVEWVEKASFDRLNKLFVIFSSEWHHQTLLIDWNLLVVVRESQLYILPILPCLAPKVLELDEHHTLNDLPFYEEGRAADAKE